MADAWVLEEMETVDLNDKRLDKRLMEVLSQLAANPTLSIPAACGGRAEMVAAYRFCDNAKASFEAVLRPHAETTARRMAAQPVVILVQDTTEIDLTRPQQQVAGAGPLDGGPRRGVLLHVLGAFTPDGTPLGTLQARVWTRGEEPVNAGLSRAARAAIPIEQKESHRWVEMLQRAREQSQRCPATQCICVADSESDIYEVLVEGMREPRTCDWIVRACENRALLGENGDAPEEKYLWEYLLEQPALLEATIQVREREPKVGCETSRRRQPRESRKAEVVVRAGRVLLRAPRRPDRKLPSVAVNAVLVSEVNPPPGEEPVQWLLLTSLPIDSVEEVKRVIQSYCVRWMIEIFFRVLKSGCRVERRQFKELDRLLTCLAIYLIVAWRTLYVCRLGRSCPEISCEAVFEPAEWKSVWKVVRRQDPPAEPPRLGEFVRMVAQLGGYVNHKGAGPPGPQTIWIGLQRMHDFATGWLLFGPGAHPPPPTCV